MSHYKILDSTALMTSERSSSLTDQVYRRIRQDIIEGRWRHDEVLFEAELATEFDVSKTPVREALRLLVQEEWATVIPSRGYLVRPVRLRDVSELYDLLLIIEPPLAGEAARRSTLHDVAALRAHVQAQQAHLADPQASLDGARLFHLAAAELAHNHRADVILERLVSEERRYHYLLNDIEAEVAADAEIVAHEEIVAAIEARDADRSREAMTRHLNEVATGMVSTFATARIGKYIAGSLAESFRRTAHFSPTEEEHMLFESAGVAIDYTDEGTGEAVVLVHGFGATAKAEWIDTGVHAELRRDYRVIAYDARGHGRSDKPHDVSAYGRELAINIVRLLDHLAIERAHVIGYSLGAHTAMHLLTLHPERFLSATLGGAPGRIDWDEADFARVSLEASEFERGSARALARRLWPAGEPEPSDDELDAVSRRVLAGKDVTALSALRRSHPDQVVTSEQVRQIDVPTRGIVGSLDPYVEQFRNLKELMPQLDLVEIEGTNHGTCRTDPRFVAAIRDHLARVG